MGPENQVLSDDNIEHSDKQPVFDDLYNGLAPLKHVEDDIKDDYYRYGTPVSAAIATTIKIGHLNGVRNGEMLKSTAGSMSRKMAGHHHHHHHQLVHLNGLHLNGVKRKLPVSDPECSLNQTMANGNGHKNVNVHYQNGVGAKNGFYKCNHHYHQNEDCRAAERLTVIANGGEKHYIYRRKASLSSSCFVIQDHCRQIDGDGKSSSSRNDNHHDDVSADVVANECRVEKNQEFNNHYERTPFLIGLLCYLSYAVLIIFGYLRDFMRNTGLEKNLAAVERDREGYTPLYKSFESFYTRNIYRRIRDCWNRPIASVPGAEIDIVDRISHDDNWTFQYPGTKTRVINMGSYNYLGYAENSGPIHQKILETLERIGGGGGACSTRNEMGISEQVMHLENLMARFLGVEACVVFGMGFATNSTNLQCFIEPGCLIMSDEHNHSSLILGCRLSGATTKVYKHNDMEDLERKIRRYILEGQPKTGRPWKKIFIIVEGIYSMEGTIVDLPGLIRIKSLYKCFIYLDEAHSIGALGPNARGVIDYFGCDPNDVDILMGTFTKSFGAAGGYIAGSRILVDTIRINSISHYYANPMSASIAQQIICVVKSLLGEDGTDEGAKRIERLAHNSRYFRRRLQQMGFIIYGHDDSPVVPLLLVFCSKIAAVLRLAHERGLGFIGAGYPATSLTSGRVRFCISAAHTKEMLDRSLEVMNEIGDRLEIKYSQQHRQTITTNIR